MKNRFSLNNDLHERDWLSLELFKQRSSILFENWSSLTSHESQFQLLLKKDVNGNIVSEGLEYDVHRVKGLYLDYRVFVANDELTNFHRVTNTIKRGFQYTECNETIDRLRLWWKKADAFKGWYGFEFDELSQVMFNAKLFHSAIDLQDKLKFVNSKMSDNTMHAILLHGVQMRIETLKVVNGLVRHTDKDNKYLILEY
jgi:hypothetical protein